MTLRKRLFWLFLPLLAVTLSSVWLLSERILLVRYDSVDKQRLYDQVRILNNRLNFERKRNLELLRIYSWWDETREFLAKPNRQYIEENLELDMLEHIGLDFVFFLNPKGEVVAQKWQLPAPGERITAGPSPMSREPLQAAIVSRAKAVGALDFASSPLGFTQMLMIGGSPVMLISHPISSNLGTLPPNGAMVAGIVLGNARLEHLQLQVGAEMKVSASTVPNASWRALTPPRANGGVLLSEVRADDTRRRIDMMFLDSRAEPQFRIQLSTPRQVFLQGQAAIRLFLDQALAILLSVLALAYLVLELWIIRPLNRLNREAASIGQNHHPERLSEVGADEFRRLTGELNRMIARLERSEERDRALLDAIREGYFEMDSAGRFLMVNAAFCKMVGRNEDELVGQPCGMLLNREDVARALGVRNQALRGETELTFSAPFKRPDGSLVILETNMSVLPSVDGELAGVRGIIRDISVQVAYQNQLLGMAYQDALTGLGNRKAFSEQLAQALHGPAGQQILALLYFDLDKFKQVNDQLGHAAGDAVLGAVGVRLRNHLRGQDKAYRLGGDEFAVILANADATHALQIASRLLGVLGEPYEFGTRSIDYITPSIGIALAPRDAQDPEALTRAADQAMYAAKRQRNACCLYSETSG
ncbi:diguanylate cyclase (GGDEF) domain protein [compost metagenome]|uniref:PAS domain S-box-containing protein/diguanylate cyclase (GGDEF) domain-containing protein n=1 Tax=Pseudomonas jinjuensis TaxID=198616 RepID=A0A1H0H7I6_9PSED|nr:diguanylate cyclase [Pseudomonas jinjuensis]SDO15102.1 PAS domain S-box-containing protein/diguanylate cyclase (GGDEF) domain-containing protein [Pseudomonas jinjuensis]